GVLLFFFCFGWARWVVFPGYMFFDVIVGVGEYGGVLGFDRLDWNLVATFGGRPAVYRCYPLRDHLILPIG
ncbi:hypothetical protein, partial [Aeromonas veronii]|uniref:hypothetical protein n=1 Tax=Aeromonas veronii TaxID=654 RepID=UPI0038B69851